MAKVEYEIEFVYPHYVLYRKIKFLYFFHIWDPIFRDRTLKWVELEYQKLKDYDKNGGEIYRQQSVPGGH